MFFFALNSFALLYYKHFLNPPNAYCMMIIIYNGDSCHAVLLDIRTYATLQKFRIYGKIRTDA